MSRPDLGSRFDGWQVVDPTPQETSDGKLVVIQSVTLCAQSLRHTLQSDWTVCL